MKNPFRPAAIVLVLASALLVACRSSDLVKGRCDKASDCSGGLTCDDHHTCVPPAPGSSPCSNDAECGMDYACDSLHWCVCQVPNQNLSPSADPCTNGTMPTYRGVTIDGGADRDGDGGDGGGVCQGRGDCSAPKPACGLAGACVECTADSDCMVATKPICDATTNTCVRCTTDAQCATKLGQDPGVCMFDQDGHCATDAEVLYVKVAAILADCPLTSTPNAGSTSLPFCQINQALAAAGTRRLIVARGDMIPSDSISNTSPISIVGQNGATIRAAGGTPGLHITGTDTYIRGLQIFGGPGTDVGMVADGNATLRLNGVTVDSMAKGGLLIDSSAFDIRNTTITNNGPGQQGSYFIGGILVTSPPGAGPTSLQLVTIENNKAPGLQCSSAIQGGGVRALGNSTADISTICGITNCMQASSTCGAQ